MMRWLAVVLAVLVWTPMAWAPAARAQEALTIDQMRTLALGDYATLTAFLPVQDAAAPPPCDMTRTGQTYALLLGADSFGPMTEIKLAGSGNSIALIGETLTTRGVNPGNVISLQGSAATRQGLTRAVDAMLGRVTCTDMVVIYATAVMFDTAAAAGMMTGGRSDQDWISDWADSDPLMRGIVEAGPYLMLNDSGAAQQEILSAGALSELMTRLRNRAAHVTLMMDTTFAASFDLAARQMAVDGRLIWRENLSEDSAGPVGPQPTPLISRAGAFSLFYAADKTSMSAEMQLPEGSAEAAVYGLFAFKLSAALRTDDALTMPSIGRQMAALELAPQYLQYQNHLIETTDAGLPILAEKLTGGLPLEPAPLVPAPGSPDVIRITAPEPSRAAEPLDTPTVVLKGRVEWPSETLIVLVGKEQALSRSDGTFEHPIELTDGLNRIEVVALTRDNRQHTRTVEVTYAGGADPLAGGGRKYALLIANQTYGGDTGMPALATPFADVDAVADVLVRRYGFVTEAVTPDGHRLPLLLRDASRAQIETTLFQLSLIAGEADQVLIYYGGHGVFEQVTGTAFWVPADAVAGVPPSYISASGISEALLRLQAASVIVVSDSCYSGALLRDAGGYAVTGEDRQRMLLRLAEKRSRVLISSGANEPVADGGGDGHSIFARAFLTALRNADGPIAAREMFDQFVLPIVVGRADQEPQYRPIARSGHEGGDFVFTPLGQ